MLQLAEEMREDPRTSPTTKCARLDAIFFPVLFVFKLQLIWSFDADLFLTETVRPPVLLKKPGSPPKKTRGQGEIFGRHLVEAYQETSADVTEHDFVAELAK